MSTIDIKIQNRCDHTVVGERLSLSSDYVTLAPQFPIASQFSIALTRFETPISNQSFIVSETPYSLFTDRYYVITLNKPDLYQDPLYEISYTTYLSTCPKCGGAVYVDDLNFQRNSDIETVTGSISLIQAVEKFIVTGRGTNRYSQWVGSSLQSLIGTKIRDVSAISSEMQNQVRSALANLSSVQVQHQSVNPSVSTSEVLDTVEIVNVTQDSVDPTVFKIFVQYTSQSGVKYDYTQILDLATVRAR